MKILMLGWEYPPHINGGLGTACDGLTKALSKFNDIKLTFVVPKVFGDENAFHMNLTEPVSVKEKNNENDLNYITKVIFPSFLTPYFNKKEKQDFLKKIRQDILNNIEKEGLKKIKENFKIDFKNFVKSNPLALEVIRYSSKLVTYFADKDFDIIHAHDWMTIIAGVVLSKITNKPLYLHIHSLEYDRSGVFNDYFVNQIEKEGVWYAKRVFAVSNYTKSVIIREHGISEKKITVVYNDVNFKRKIKYKISPSLLKYKYVVFLGRVTSQKGPGYFVRAAKKVLQNVDDVKFIIGGKGDKLYEIMERVKQEGIQDDFIFTGFLNSEEVTKILALSDIFVMPSFSEPFGIVALEAVYYDTPVVLTKQSGVSEVLKSAPTFDFWDTEKQADEIIYLLKNEEKREEVLENLKEEMKALSWDKSAQIIHGEYEKEFWQEKAC